MAADRLQMIAELIDKNVGANAKKIEKAFADLGKAHARDLPAAFKKYQTAVTGQEKALEQFTKRSVTVRREMEAFKQIAGKTFPMVTELTKSVGAFTLGTGAMVGAIGAVGLALYEAGRSAIEFAEAMKKIRFGSEETGLGRLQIKQLVQALGEFDISADEVASGFRGLRRARTDMTRHSDIFKDKIAALGGDVFKYANPVIEIAKAGGTTAQVYAEIIKQLDRISADQPDKGKAMDLRSRFVEQFGLSPKFARAGDAALREKMEIIKKLGTTGDEMHAAAEAADRLDKVLEEGRASLDKWLTLVGTTITEVLLYINKVMDKIRDTFNFSKLKQLGALLAPATGGTSVAASNLLEWYMSRHPDVPKFAEGGLVTKPTLAVIGEKEPEYIIPARAFAFIRSIGRTETDFNRRQAYSEQYNRSSNNPNVAKYGQAGADYGYFQNNDMDARDAAKRGVPSEMAGHLAGGAGVQSTLRQQTGAMNEYIKRRYAKQYADLIAGGSFENMRRATQGQWHGLRNSAKAEEEFNTSMGSRMSINAALSGGQIDTTGQLDVNVRAPRGTKVKAEGGGIFEKTNVRRNIQMQTAPGGPPQ